MPLLPATHPHRPIRHRPAPPKGASPTHARIPALLDLLLRALLATLLGRPARTRRLSWHYTHAALPGDGAAHAPTTTIPRPLRRGSPDIIIAQAHAGPRRHTCARPAPPQAPATTARAPPRPPHARKRPRSRGAQA